MKTKTDLVQLTIKEPDQSIFRDSEAALERAQNWRITTPEMARVAGVELRAVKRLAKEIEEKRLAITKPINAGLREVNNLFKPAKDFLSHAESVLKAKLLGFQRDQERIARKLQAELAEVAEIERKKLEKKAAKAEAKGKTEKADDLREQAETHIAPVVIPAVPKQEGISTRKTWRVRITNKPALLKHIVNERPDLLPLVQISETALTAQARSLKGEFGLPGIEVTEEESIVARS